MAVMPLEFFLFRNYTIGLKNWLRENLYLSSYPVDENITVAFTTPDKAWAKYIYPVVNGATVSPNINFNLTSIEYAETENFLGFVTEAKPIAGSTKVKSLRAPLVYKLTYSAILYTRVMSEMDILLYQLISKAHKNAKGVITVDGQWAEINAINPRNETNLEPGDAQDKVVRWGIDFNIPRAYLPLDYVESETVQDYEITYSAGYDEL